MSNTFEGGKKTAENRNNAENRNSNRGSKDYDIRGEAGKKADETRGNENVSEAGKKGGEHSQGAGRSSSSE